MIERRAPIGVFDSGVGGLTVLRALRAALPHDRFIYLGDTARLPYGTKSAASVARYSVQCARVLHDRGIGCLVVACNTASASALGELRVAFPDIPVVGVIEPGADAAVAASRTQHIAVIATEGTVAGGAYRAAIQRRCRSARVTSQACSLFVALAEEGWVAGPVAESAARRYLEPMFASADAADTLVLGCTHFPVLAGVIRTVLPPHVVLVDSAATVAVTVAAMRGSDPDPDPEPPPAGRVTWLATDGAARFARVGSVFLGAPLHAEEIEIVDL